MAKHGKKLGKKKSKKIKRQKPMIRGKKIK